MKPVMYPSARVSQLDSNFLDIELHSILKEQLTRVFSLPSLQLTSFLPDPRLLSLFIRILVFYQTVWKSSASYGLSLQRLRLCDRATGQAIGKRKRIAIVFGILLWYGREYINLYALLANGMKTPHAHKDNSLSARLKHKLLQFFSKMMPSIFKIGTFLSLVNFVGFLIYGKYPNIYYRLLGIILIPVSAESARITGDEVNYEFQNHQLVWTVMTELVVFTIPLLKLGKLQRLARSIGLQLVPCRNRASNTGNAVALGKLPILQCVICIKSQQSNDQARHSANPMCLITNPMITNCGHVFCYVCIATTLNAAEKSGDEAHCFRCNSEITSFEEYGADDVIKSKAIFFEELDYDSESDKCEELEAEQGSVSIAEQDSYENETCDDEFVTEFGQSEDEAYEDN